MRIVLIAMLLLLSCSTHYHRRFLRVEGNRMGYVGQIYLMPVVHVGSPWGGFSTDPRYPTSLLK